MLINRQKQQDANTKEFYAFINHLMSNKGGCCHGPSKRYCAVGLKLKREYEDSKK